MLYLRLHVEIYSIFFVGNTDFSNAKGAILSSKMASDSDVVRITHGELVRLSENYDTKEQNENTTTASKGIDIFMLIYVLQ